MTHQVFTPPVAAKQLPGQSRLYQYIRGDASYTVYQKQDGSFVKTQQPFDDDLKAAKFVYLGGHRTTVSAAEVTALTAAGYGAYITTEPDL